MKTRYLLFSVLFLLGCISCSEDDPGPQEITKGDIEGFVKLFDEGTTALSNADMTVRLDGLDISAKTDAEGKFTLKDVPFGVYTLIYEKPGYGTYESSFISHSKYSPGYKTIINYTPYLGQVSSTKVTSLSAEVIGTEVVLTVTTDPSGSFEDKRYIRFLYGSEQLFGEDFVINMESGLNFFDYGVSTSQSNPFNITIPLAFFLTWGSDWETPFSSGEEIVVRAFGESLWDNAYFDPNLEIMIYPNLNPSAANQVSFILP